MSSTSQAGVLDAAINNVDAALMSAADAKRSEVEAAERDRAARHHEYLSILVRSETPKPGDTERLTALILELGLSTDDVRGDSAKITRVAERLPVIARRDHLRDVYKAAVDAKNDLKERHKLELEAAEKESSHAAHEYRKAGWFEDDVLKIFKESPEVFAPGLLTLPPAIAARVQAPAKAPPVPHAGPKIQKQINGRWVEPIVGDDGQYGRDAGGNYVYSSKEFPQPLLDDRGRPVVDRDGKYVYPKPPAAEPTPASEADESRDPAAD